jgi:hypothetical protein
LVACGQVGRKPRVIVIVFEITAALMLHLNAVRYFSLVSFVLFGWLITAASGFERTLSGK